MSTVRNEIQLTAVAVSIASPYSIDGILVSSPIETSTNQSLRALCDQILRVATTGLTNDGERFLFDSDETVGQLVQRQKSSRIFVFPIEDKNRPSQSEKISFSRWFSQRNSIQPIKNRRNYIDLFIEAMNCLHHRQHFNDSLYIHLHQISEKKITQIISIPLTAGGSISSTEIQRWVSKALKEYFSNGLDYLVDG